MQITLGGYLPETGAVPCRGSGQPMLSESLKMTKGRQCAKKMYSQKRDHQAPQQHSAPYKARL